MHFPGLSRSSSGFRVLHKGTDLVGCAFCAFPGLSSPGDLVLCEHIVRGGLCVLITSPVLAARFPGALQEHCLRCACVSSGELTLRLRPSWQGPRKTWLAAGSLLTVWWRMPSLRLRLPLAFRLRLLHACLSASSAGKGSIRNPLALF